MATIAKLPSGVRPADIPERQHTTRCAVEIAAGAAVRLDPATGEWRPASTVDAASANFYGILLEHGYAREYRTAVGRGKIAGFDLSAVGQGGNVQLGRTAGTLADATDATAGAVNVAIGKVVPATADGYPPFDKLLEVG